MEDPIGFPVRRARAIGKRIGTDWETPRFDLEQLRLGVGVVTDDDKVTTEKIALALLHEFPDSYTPGQDGG